ncbi:MAG TPA: alpha/beta hydrolase [Chloroflexia bacterium]|nr:alpha/beta hydrolase [Chloroflexia bacterium]
MSAPLLPGVESRVIPTDRLKIRVLLSGPAAGVPVVFVHGNAAAARFWEETMLALPAGYRGLAPDLRGYGETEPQPIDGTQGLREWADDLAALFASLRLDRAHLVGWSMGGGVALQYAIDHAPAIQSLTLVDPVSPFGFGGTRDAAGTPNYPDFAGSGGGTVNPEFVRRLAAGDRSADDPNSPRNVMNTFYFKPPFRAAPEREDVFVEDILAQRTGEGFYPGDLTTSPNWPGVAPGAHGVANAFAPRYCNLSAFATITPRPPVLWVRGADDQIVADTSLFDFGFLGQLGAVPGWPGAAIYPPQPMVAQTRALLDAYRAAGGQYEETVIADCGHSPHIEHPATFQAALRAHLAAADGRSS